MIGITKDIGALSVEPGLQGGLRRRPSEGARNRDGERPVRAGRPPVQPKVPSIVGSGAIHAKSTAAKPASIGGREALRRHGERSENPDPGGGRN